jgi:hypothetical protein
MVEAADSVQLTGKEARPGLQTEMMSLFNGILFIFIPP